MVGVVRKIAGQDGKPMPLGGVFDNMQISETF